MLSEDLEPHLARHGQPSMPLVALLLHPSCDEHEAGYHLTGLQDFGCAGLCLAWLLPIWSHPLIVWLSAALTLSLVTTCRWSCQS
jgi:hypothetical protein